MADGVSELVPGDERAWFRKGFSRWLRGHFAKRFHAVRLASGTRAISAHTGTSAHTICGIAIPLAGLLAAFPRLRSLTL